MDRGDQISHLNLAHVIDPAGWQNIQDIYSAITGVGVYTVNNRAEAIGVQSGQPNFCRYILTHGRYATCKRACLPTFLGGKAVVDNNSRSFCCPLGLYHAMVPVTLQDHILGYVILGPVVLTSRKPKEKYILAAEEMGIDPEVLWSALFKIKVVNTARIDLFAKLMGLISQYVTELSYASRNDAAVDIVQNACIRSKGLLNLILEAGLQLTKAQTGSLMIMERSNQELTIRASRGLPEDIVKNTRVKFGEGISGIAAKERKTFIFNDRSTDLRFALSLKRPALRSSVVIPLGYDDRIVGVVNLSSLDDVSGYLNQESIRVMQGLVDLAADVLYTPLKKHIPTKSDCFQQLL